MTPSISGTLSSWPPGLLPFENPANDDEMSTRNLLNAEDEDEDEEDEDEEDDEEEDEVVGSGVAVVGFC